MRNEKHKTKWRCLVSLSLMALVPAISNADEELTPSMADQASDQSPTSEAVSNPKPTDNKPAGTEQKQTRNKARQEQRTPRYAGIGIGGGPARIRMGQEWNSPTTLLCRGIEERYSQRCKTDEAVDLTGFFEFGKTIDSKTLLGLHVSGRGSSMSIEDQDGWTHTHSVSLVEGIILLSWFPSERGFVLRGGLGPAFYAENVRSIKEGTTRQERTGMFGFGAMAGFGYAFWLGKRFNLVLSNDFHIDKLLGDEVNCEANLGWYNATQLGFMWY